MSSRVTADNSKKGTGYTNLMNHLDAKHENFKSIYQQYLGITTSPMISFNYDTSVRNIFYLVSLIIKCQLPLNACESPDFVLHTGLSKLDALTVDKYLNSLANIVQERIKNTLPEKVGIMFGGWMNNGIHFVGLFGIYQTVHESRNLVLLAYSPIEDCTTQNADAHNKFFKGVLELYIKGVKNVLFLSEATNDLQNESMNLDDVHAYFDLLIEEHPDLEWQLEKNASIIQDPSFEEAVIKVLHKQESVLTSSEKQKLQLFIVEQSMQLIENELITIKDQVAKNKT
ncbi:32077_t:CDS:2 [Gigaspora margarita]|uniref:32077_t:CDS:1 n=1 Tax=Gigaspora margarita TaxID=4874 RepID=A0ABN7V4H4_GIGMA|nr:32077_t:CDS:2 [Gigaspora margarita]